MSKSPLSNSMVSKHYPTGVPARPMIDYVPYQLVERTKKRVRSGKSDLSSTPGTSNSVTSSSSANVSSVGGKNPRVDSLATRSSASTAAPEPPRSISEEAPEVVHPAFRSGVEVAGEEPVSPMTVAPVPDDATAEAPRSKRFSKFRFGEASEENLHSPAVSTKRRSVLSFGKQDCKENFSSEIPLRRKRTLANLRHSVIEVGRQLVGRKRTRGELDDDDDDDQGRQQPVGKVPRLEHETYRDSRHYDLAHRPGDGADANDDATSLYASTTYSAICANPFDGEQEPGELDGVPVRPASPDLTFRWAGNQVTEFRRYIRAAESDEWEMELS